MNILLNWFTRKKMVSFSIFFVFVYLLSYFNRLLKLPYFYREFCCIDDRVLNLFFIFIPIFVFTIIFVNFNDTKFLSWKKITLIYLIIFIFLYFIAPTKGDGFIWLQRETVSFLGTILYSIISFGLILYKSFKK